MEDTLRPGKVEIQGMLAKSLYTWKSYQTDGNGELPSDSVNPSAMLGHVPAFLGIHLSEHPLQHHLETNDDLWITGNATWRTTTGECDLPKKVLSQRLLLGVSSRASCSFTEDNRFRDWPGIENVENSAKGNYIAILTLAWCYIFSAKWVEMQSQRNPDNSISTNSEQLAYLNSLAYWTTHAADNSAGDIDIDLGGIGNDAARWWTAILAPGHGWQACIFRFGRKYLSPWSIRLLAQERFVLRRTPDIQDPDTEPPVMAENTAPSSDLALQYLSDFCDLHQIYGQCFAALAATLLIPYRAGAEQLLLPKPNIWPHPHTLPISPPSCNLHNQANLLPFYMTLSCNIRGVRPLLHGSLFEPSVTCNLLPQLPRRMPYPPFVTTSQAEPTGSDSAMVIRPPSQRFGVSPATTPTRPSSTPATRPTPVVDLTQQTSTPTRPPTTAHVSPITDLTSDASEHTATPTQLRTDGRQRMGPIVDKPAGWTRKLHDWTGKPRDGYNLAMFRVKVLDPDRDVPDNWAVRLPVDDNGMTHEEDETHALSGPVVDFDSVREDGHNGYWRRPPSRCGGASTPGEILR
jgi:hypothetical protein